MITRESGHVTGVNGGLAYLLRTLDITIIKTLAGSPSWSAALANTNPICMSCTYVACPAGNSHSELNAISCVVLEFIQAPPSAAALLNV